MDKINKSFVVNVSKEILQNQIKYNRNQIKKVKININENGTFDFPNGWYQTNEIYIRYKK